MIISRRKILALTPIIPFEMSKASLSEKDVSGSLSPLEVVRKGLRKLKIPKMQPS